MKPIAKIAGTNNSIYGEFTYPGLQVMLEQKTTYKICLCVLVSLISGGVETNQRTRRVSKVGRVP